MRITAKIELSIDVPETNKEAQETFETLVREECQLMYTQSTFISKYPVWITVTLSDDAVGERDISLT